jgi:hypothetical protein
MPLIASTALKIQVQDHLLRTSSSTCWRSSVIVNRLPAQPTPLPVRLRARV